MTARAASPNFSNKAFPCTCAVRGIFYLQSCLMTFEMDFTKKDGFGRKVGETPGDLVEMLHVSKIFCT